MVDEQEETNEATFFLTKTEYAITSLPGRMLEEEKINIKNERLDQVWKGKQ